MGMVYLQFVPAMMMIPILVCYILALSDVHIPTTAARILSLHVFPLYHIANPVIYVLVPAIRQRRKEQQQVAIKVASG